ncbi:MAG: polysaccharide deacetylase family protein, partial [Gammaproteobacteria bacterium]|nr:polysaccharide deacetylase family protein [Gammaproteobacteria bacterium]
MRQLIKDSIKKTIAYSLYYSGTLALLLKIKLRNKLVVLMYHRVLETDKMENSYSNAGIVVRKETFDIHVQYLMTHFKPLSLNQVTEHIEEKLMFNSGHCLITFDDGWIDNYSNAFFLLKKHKAPALIFLPTNYISSQNLFWQERLSCIIFNILKNCKEVPNVLVEKGLDKLNNN